MTKKPAVLIISYQRPSNLYSILSDSYSFGIRDFYVAIDGPKTTGNPEIKATYNQELSRFQLQNECNLKVWIREKNLGLAPSMISAIDWFFENVDSGIILEDDLKISKSFIEFMQISLEYYEKDSKVLMVSGNQFYSPHSENNEIFFSHYPLIWGWSTWKDRWCLFRKALIDGNIAVAHSQVSKKVEYFWRLGAIRSLSCRVNSWAILLATYSRLRGYVCISPGANLTTNNGADIYASHTLHPHWTLGISVVEEIPTNLRWANKINLDVFLEKKVFEVKEKHRLLILKILTIKFFDFFSPRTGLIDRLKNVEYPEMKNPYASG